MTYNNYQQATHITIIQNHWFLSLPLPNKLLVQIQNLMKHVSQTPMSLYSICMAPIQVDVDVYSGNSHKYTQMYAHSTYITIYLIHMFL